MKAIRAIASLTLAAMFGLALLAGVISPAPYAEQFRELPNSSPSAKFWLGTDDLGRDRLSRLLYGTRVSLLLAPAAALLSTLAAAIVGGVAGYLGGRWDRVITGAIDLFLSLPWLFLLLAARAMLPLDASPYASIGITFGLLGLLGWPVSARVVRSGLQHLITSDFALAARASGCRSFRILIVHLLPNVKPVLLAQFWISIPAFILAEANLGLLGLGVAEPVPSWGSLLRELENFSAVSANPWMLAPVVTLLITVSCFQLVLSKWEVSQ